MEKKANLKAVSFLVLVQFIPGESAEEVILINWWCHGLSIAASAVPVLQQRHVLVYHL
jgi:hypothetical protein